MASQEHGLQIFVLRCGCPPFVVGAKVKPRQQRLENIAQLTTTRDRARNVVYDAPNGFDVLVGRACLYA
jgi:hypothetical protein